jgi:pyridoxine 5-phosphate synthase
MRLYINIDHVATVRQARRASEPDPVEAALAAESAGADGITAHLREDRRHIQDADVERLVGAVTTVLNLELACTDEMLRIAERLTPFQVTFVPERREEITTEGGLDISAKAESSRGADGIVTVATGIARLRAKGVRASLFIDPTEAAVRRAKELGADAIELHTGSYAHSPGQRSIAALAVAAKLGHELGMAVHAGHGLTTGNVAAVAAIAEIEELNIGHHIVSRSILVGIEDAVREMRAAITRGRVASESGE